MWAAEGWSYKLTRLVPQTYVAPFAYYGELLSGAEAEHIGLVHGTYPPGEDLRISAKSFLDRLAGIDQRTYTRTKRSILESLDLSFDQALYSLSGE